MKNELFYSINDLAAAVSLSRWSIHEAMKRGELNYVKHGRRTLIPAAEAREWIKTFDARRGRHAGDA